jgi:GTP-binding protein
MFNDKAKIHVQAGKGGDGGLSFRREKFVPKGGPDGGDGGKGGDVVFVADPSLRDLSSLQRRRWIKASRGENGRGARKHGADGGDVEVHVPVGTQVFDDEEHLIADLAHPGARVVLAHGGHGGRGNARFVSSTRQVPRFAEVGPPGEERDVELHLKLLADAALVGLPNAGKSSLLRRISNARPKVADYPFTTLQPVLGTVESPDGRQLVVADVPGLIKGASEGVGLGHEFLAHVERTRLLVHVLDVQPLDGSDPVANHATVERELELHDPRLSALPRVLALSKVDLVGAAVGSAAQERWEARLGPDVPVILTSSVTRAGLDVLARELVRQVPAVRDDEQAGVTGEALPNGAELAEHRVFRPAAERAYRVERTGERSYRVSGPGIERLLARYDLDNEDALAHLERRLRGIGVLRALETEGFEPGDEVEIAGVAFDLDPNV